MTDERDRLLELQGAKPEYIAYCRKVREPVIVTASDGQEVHGDDDGECD